MDQLIELLEQIQELAGVGIDALKEATGGEGGEKKPGEKPGEKPPGGEAPEGGRRAPEGEAPEGATAPEGEAPEEEEKKRPPFGRR